MSDDIATIWKDADVQSFVKAVLLLGSMDEAKNFLRDLLTEPEITELAKRWKAARMLSAGIPYTQIERETGLSSATIARVSRWLREGSGGYQMMLERFVEEPSMTQPSNEISSLVEERTVESKPQR